MIYNELFQLLEIDNGWIVCRGQEKIDVMGSSSPRIDVRSSSSPRIYVMGPSSPMIYVMGSSSPRIDVRGSSSPRIYVMDSSSPMIDVMDSSSPMIYVRSSSSINKIILLGNEIPRGYIRALMVDDDGTPWFVAGCHKLTLADARTHWGSSHYPDRERGDEYLLLIDFAERLAEKKGWIA